VATLFFQWGRCYSGFVTPLYGALLASLAVRALENALMQRGHPESVIVHSDSKNRSA